MALKTLGTAATTTLQAAQWNSGMAPGDLAALNALFKYGSGVGSSPAPVTYRPLIVLAHGMMWIPGRGSLKLYEGDWVGADPNTGLPVLLNAATAAAASWVHS